MSRLPDAVGRSALGLYSGAPTSARAHVAIRLMSCPIPDIAALVPSRGRILEVGCGHGLVSAYLALGSADREVTGVDIDPDKIAIAQVAAAQARRRGARLTLETAPSGDLPPGPWDAIVFVDVLYLLDVDAQRELLASSRRHLVADGRIIVKEMGTQPRWKARWNELQELISVRVLRITEGDTLTFVSPEDTARDLRAMGLVTRQVRLDRGRVHPHHAVVAESRPR